MSDHKNFTIKRENSFVILDKRILQNPCLSLDGKGYYGMFEAKCIEWEEIPEIYRKEIILAQSQKEISNE
jgi:hypothetical protein